MKNFPVLLAAAMLAATGCEKSVSLLDGKPAAGADEKPAAPGIDFDFPAMNRVMRQTYSYRLAANLREFEGKVLRLGGLFLVRTDEDDGKRFYGCLVGEAGGCSCCSVLGVLEFIPKGDLRWPDDFPAVESAITITGRLAMFEEGDMEKRQGIYHIPRLVDAVFEK